MSIINWEIARNPLNWVIIFLMVAIIAIGAQLVVSSSSL